MIPSPSIRQVEHTRKWVFTEDFSFEWDGIKWHFKKGFKYDRATVPEYIPAWIISKDDLGSTAPAVHDALYRYRGLIPKDGTGWVKIEPWRYYTRHEANGLFRDILKEQGVKRWRCTLAYTFVEIFSRRW